MTSDEPKTLAGDSSRAGADLAGASGETRPTPSPASEEERDRLITCAFCVVKFRVADRWWCNECGLEFCSAYCFSKHECGA